MPARRVVFALCLVAAAAALIAHSLAFNFVTDDAYISFVYARNLARHGELVFNLGERVEGYTNFLWTVILAGLLKVGLVPEVTARVLGTACGVAGLVVAAALGRRLRLTDEGGTGLTTAANGLTTGTDEGGTGLTTATNGLTTAAPAWSAWDALPALLLAGVPGYACWSSGGLETQLFTLLVTLGMTAYLGSVVAGGGLPATAGLAFGLAALTRPEGILFFAVTALHRLAARRRARAWWPARGEWAALALFLLLVVPHFLWRRWYYGWWLPNTFYIKSSGGSGTWRQGGYYLGRFVEQFHLWAVPLLVIAAFAVVARARRGAFATAAGYGALVGAVFCLYVASVAGDFMGLFRFALPIVPLLLVLAAAALRLLCAPLATRRPQAALAVVALVLAGHGAHAWAVDQRALAIGSDRGIDTPGYLRWYTNDRAAIGKWFNQYAHPDDYAAVGGAGAQVYYSGIRSLDCYGLSDAYIAHEVPAMSSRPGHQKYAPDTYILSRRPTIITSYNYRILPAPYVGADATLWMARGYRYVSVEVPGLSSRWYSFLLRNDRSLGPLPRLDELREP